MRDCTIMLDGKVIIENGKVIDPVMNVAKAKRG